MRMGWRGPSRGSAVPDLRLLGGVVEDNLPALVGLFEDEREVAFGGTAVFLASIETIFSDAGGEVFAEGMDLEVGEAESAHGGFGGIVAAVLSEQACEPVVDCAGDEDGVR